MNSWNSIIRIAVTIAVILIGLSGCGGAGDNSNNASAMVTTVSPNQSNDKIPGAPTGVLAVGGTNKVTLSWNAVGSATAYNVYWLTTPGVSTTTGTRISSNNPACIHRGLLPAVTYFYIVTVQTRSGESSASGEVSASTAALDGSAPYSAFCERCHGRLEISDVTNSGVATIKAALQTISQMYTLVLTDSQIAAISAALMYND